MANQSTAVSRGAKLLPPSTIQRARLLWPTLIVLLIVAGLLQSTIDPLHKQYEPKQQQNLTAMGGLNNEFLLLPLLGFREAAAGLLWVRCDEFFHSGDYDAILPLVRVITWLDPHADNVFITGAWHLSYNFTDSSERSDRRYIAPSEALLDEGIANNEFIPDIKFEKGWQNYDKIKNFPAAEAAFLDAIHTKPNPNSDDYPYGAPLKTWHILAHTYEKEGRIPEALAAWNRALEISSALLAKNKTDFSNKMLHAAEKHNHDETLQRYYDRYTTARHSHNNTSSYRGIDWPFGGSNKPGPWDVSLHASIDVVRPKVLKIHGLFNAADGARVDVLITDWNYKPHIPNTATAFAVDPDQTILMDSIAVRKNGFEREMDMSKDPKMYSFSQDYYKIVLSFNPRTTSPHETDRFGWSGEGLTDSDPNHLYVDGSPGRLGTPLVEGYGSTGPLWDGVAVPTFEDREMPPMPHSQPARIIKVTYKVTRAQLEGNGAITDKDIVPNQADQIPGF